MNTRRMNRLEELGRVDAEKAFTKKGARNLKDEKKRIVRELKANGGKVLKKVKPSQKGLKKLPTKVRKVMREFKKGKLNIGGSKKKVKNRKQAIAIALSEAGISKRRKK